MKKQEICARKQRTTMMEMKIIYVSILNVGDLERLISTSVTIKPKLDGLKILLQNSKKSDILEMCETFLDDKTEDNLLHKMV